LASGIWDFPVSEASVVPDFSWIMAREGVVDG
jgi:hypothetical protein